MKLNREKGYVRFMAPLVLGNMLNPLNSTMLATAIVTICTVFHQETGNGSLLIVPLYLTSAIGQPLMGRLCDVFSAYKINMIGLVLVLLSALIGVAAPSFAWLIVSRILLGLGTSAAYPSSISLVKQRYSALNMPVPGATLGLIAISSQVSLAFGPFLGGLLVERWGWRGIFFINIPIVLIGVLLSIRKKRTDVVAIPVPSKSLRQVFIDLDPIGLSAFSAFMLGFLLILLYPDHLLLTIPALILILVFLIRQELRHPNPFINVRLLAVNVQLNTTFLRQMAITFILYLILYGLPQWLQQTKGIGPSNVGLLMLPQSIAAMAMSLLLSAKKNYLRQLSFGTFFIVAASAGLFFFQKDTSLGLIVFDSVLSGMALGILTIANQSTLYAVAPDDQVGISFGLFRTVSYIGAIVAGSRLKHEFRHSATDTGLHQLALYALISCGVIILFMVPVYYRYFRDRPIVRLDG